MTRNLKILGLALAAVLAMSAVTASAASATPVFVGEVGETMGEGGAGETFSTEAGDVVCSSSTFTGNAEVEETSSESTHPEYSGCKAFGFVSATVDTEDCDYVFNLESKLGEGPLELGEYTANVDVDCPDGDSIKITAASCAAEVGSQEGLDHVVITNKTANERMDLTVHSTVSSIEYNVTNDGFLCPFSGTGVRNDGEYNTTSPVTYTGVGDITVEGE